MSKKILAVSSEQKRFMKTLFARRQSSRNSVSYYSIDLVLQREIAQRPFNTSTVKSYFLWDGFAAQTDRQKS